MSKITLQAIADQLGISKFAVSRALSGKVGVSEQTRALVRSKAVELGYFKGAGAAPRAAIHIVFHDHDPVNSELWMQMQNGIQSEAALSGYEVQLHWTRSAEQIENVARASAGMVLVGQHGEETLAALRRTRKPVVRLGWVSPLDPVDQVTGADHEAGSAIGQYLRERGHRIVGFVHGTRVLRGRMERLFGLNEAYVGCPGARVHEIQYGEEGFATAFKTLLEQGDRPTALFCSHDGLAVHVISELHRLGYKVPEDISIIGYGDFAAALQISPPLTTIRLPGEDMGIAAFRLLLERMNSSRRQLPPQRVMIVPKLIERESVFRLQQD
ncbi:LacI family transcriptional regulator [Devosia neptuniae]|uniref:LacI family transcriptional regulator n=1 Tax=Devosia neptuniae TaxID=191302 RepID=A0ABY6CI03_9HYPH|nr:LacI family DNA-binding transcriptional regulator [Devosia neptuniae]UXN71855.1 LacI family transcriptional regulator [Devosia neptuniae]